MSSDSSKAWDNTLKTVREEISAILTRQGFLTDRDIQGIWTRDRLNNILSSKFLNKAGGTLSLEFLQNRLKILSILAEIGWPTSDWKDFSNRFTRADRHDGRLPFTKDTLEFFLRPGVATKFCDKQWSFKPAKIRQQVNTQTLNKNELPFDKDASKELKAGGMSKSVSVDYIPAGYYIDDRNITSTKTVTVVRKVVDRYYKTEISNLKQFASSFTQCDYISRYLAIIDHSADRKAEFSILMPRADSDLGKCLFYESESDKYWNPEDITMRNLLSEAAELAGGLNWLHTGAQFPGKIAGCCHMDLKPDNILVFNQARCPLGRWKIADFGLAAIRTPVPKTNGAENDDSKYAPQDHRDSFPTIQTISKKDADVYTAPEIYYKKEKIGRTSDIWSYGCILMDLVASRMTEKLSARNMQSRRKLSTNGEQYKDEDYFFRGDDLNPQVKLWLDRIGDPEIKHSLINPDENSVLLDCQDLFRRMLNVIPQRPPAFEVREELLNISERLPRSSNSARDEDEQYIEDSSMQGINVSSLEPPYLNSHDAILKSFSKIPLVANSNLLAVIGMWLSDKKSGAFWVEDLRRAGTSPLFSGLYQAAKREGTSFFYHTCYPDNEKRSKIDTRHEILLDLIHSLIYQLQTYLNEHQPHIRPVSQQQYNDLKDAKGAVNTATEILQVLWNAMPCPSLCIINDFQELEASANVTTKEEIRSFIKVLCQNIAANPVKKTMVTTSGRSSSFAGLPMRCRLNVASHTSGVETSVQDFLRPYLRKFAKD